MNRKTVLIVLGIILLIAAAILYVLLLPNKQNRVTNTPQMETNTVKNESPASTSSPASGTYIPYSETAVKEASGTILLFFHAPWCPQCRQLETSIEADGVPAGVTVFKVDYDSHQDLRRQYDVTLQTTFVKIDKDGNKQASYVAYDEPVFSSVKRELLP